MLTRIILAVALALSAMQVVPASAQKWCFQNYDSSGAPTAPYCS
jgi:hypothetical protein